MSFRRAFLLGCCSAALFVCAYCQPQPSTPGRPATASSARTQNSQAYTLPTDKLAKAIALARIQNILAIAGPLYDIALLWLFLALRWSARLEAWTMRISARRWLQGLLYFAVFIALAWIADLPLAVYGQSVSLSYGIGVQSWIGWLVDQAKSLGLSLGFGAPILLFFNWIIRVSPRRYWAWAWLAAVVFLIAGDYGQPYYASIYDSFEPLAARYPDLAQKLEKVVARTGTNIPPERMFLMKASLKTNGLNAYVSGIGSTKRIVVWDTTAGRIPEDEIQFIFGHETGHYVLNHVTKGLCLYALGALVVFWLGAWLVARLLQRPGSRQPSSRTSLVLRLLVLSIAAFLLEPVTNAVSRHFEHQADVYGQEAIHGIVADPQKTAVSAFNHLGEAWLEDPNPSPFIEFWLYNHPSTQNRANFAAHYDPWANGGRGEFFDK